MKKTDQYALGDRVLWVDSGAATITGFDPKTGGPVIVLDGDNDCTQHPDLCDLEPLVPLTVEDVTYRTTDKPTGFGFGYVITEDGVIYDLHKQHYHGVVCAILFPEMAKAGGYEPPYRGAVDVFKYQRFELDNHKTLPVIRIAFSMFSPMTVSKGDKPATAKQIDGLRKILKARGMGLQDKVCSEWANEVTVRKLLKEMERTYG